MIFLSIIICINLFIMEDKVQYTRKTALTGFNFLLFLALTLTLFSDNFASAVFLPQEDPYAAFAEVMPEPSGGMSAITKKIAYPETARKNGIEGKVYVLVMVNEKGGVDNVKVIRGIGAGCDEAAVKAVKETKFSPGKNKGINIKVKLSLPITFKL